MEKREESAATIKTSDEELLFYLDSRIIIFFYLYLWLEFIFIVDS